MKRAPQIGIATSMLLVVPALALAQAAGGVQNSVKIVNGKKISGNVYPQMLGPAQSSSAFLAFSETWIK